MYTYKIIKAKTLNSTYKIGWAVVIYKDDNKIDTLFFPNKKMSVSYSGGLYMRFGGIEQIFK